MQSSWPPPSSGSVAARARLVLDEAEDLRESMESRSNLARASDPAGLCLSSSLALLLGASRVV